MKKQRRSNTAALTLLTIGCFALSSVAINASTYSSDGAQIIEASNVTFDESSEILQRRLEPGPGPGSIRQYIKWLRWFM